jgi:DNA-binding NarL/FixJ family response regulator
MSNYKIIVVDDNNNLRSALKILISRVSEFQVIDDTNRGEELIEKLSEKKCDLVWIDPKLEDVDGMALLSQIRKNFPKIKIMTYISAYDYKTIESLITLKIDGILFKDDFFSMIPIAIQSIRDGGIFYSDRINH